MSALGDSDLAATVIADEAAEQPYEGKVAVAVVLLNRVKLPYASDGTLPGAAYHKWGYSGLWATMVHGTYTQISFSLADAEAEAEKLCAGFKAQGQLWADCQRAWMDAQAWRAAGTLSFQPGPAFSGLTEETVLYYNPKICRAPYWATPENQDAVIYRHTFFHDGTWLASRKLPA